MPLFLLSRVNTWRIVGKRSYPDNRPVTMASPRGQSYFAMIVRGLKNPGSVACLAFTCTDYHRSTSGQITRFGDLLVPVEELGLDILGVTGYPSGTGCSLPKGDEFRS